MINVLVDKSSSRLTYCCEVIFNYILKTKYQIVELNDLEKFKSENQHQELHIDYTNNKVCNGIQIPNTGLLHKEDIIEVELNIRIEIFAKIFSVDNEDFDLNFDLFSATFYLITEYEKYVKKDYDKHGRYLESSYSNFGKGLHKFPLVNQYAEFLWKLLKERFSTLEREPASFNYEITIDVDFPWAYLNKGLLTYGGLLKDLFTFDFINLRQRFKAIKSKIDPYYSFLEIYKLCLPQNTKFFLLNRGKSKFDSRYAFKDPIYSELIKDIVERGYECAIHPSYYSFKEKGLIIKEKGALEYVAGKQIFSSRQHFLNYKLPDTYRFLIEAGINHDYTSSLISSIGFKYSIATPFPWFDLESNSQSSLIIHPTMVMDVSLKDYLRLGKEEALKETFQIIDRTVDVNGKFVLLWHNNSLSEIHGWEGWTYVFKEIMNYLKEK